MTSTPSHTLRPLSPDLECVHPRIPQWNRGALTSIRNIRSQILRDAQARPKKSSSKKGGPTKGKKKRSALDKVPESVRALLSPELLKQLEES